MTKRRKRTILITYSFVGMVIEYIMYLLAGGWEKGNTVFEWIPRVEKIMQQPFGWYFNGYTVYFLLIGVAITGFLIMNELTKPVYMPGKEYGTAHWGDVQELTKKLTKKKEPEVIRQYSENFKMSTDSDYTNRNNNVLIIGGSGARKTWSGLQPNLWMENGSMMITDPKGELLARNGKRLIRDGYIVRVLDLIDMDASDRYDPFAYIKDSTDISRLVRSIMKNTDGEEEKRGGDPFWEKSESMFLEALFLYVWMEEPVVTRTMRSVMKLLEKAQYNADGLPSELDDIMNALEAKKGGNHPAVQKYREVMDGAGDTIRSIIICVHVRMSAFEDSKVISLFEHDDFQIGTLGTGINMDGRTKTAIFVKIPDNDTTYNFIAGMFYTQACMELYRLADRVYHGKLPIPVTFWWDEFANIALPKDFLHWISTCRSRNLSCVIIIQGMSQLKTLYEKGWEAIPGNCDVLLYLGGNEQSTHEYMSKLLGKQTIYKKSTSESRGMHGSTSRTTDVLGRDLMTIDEVAALDNENVIIKVRGYNPIMDKKYVPFNKENYKILKELGVYIHKPMRSNTYFKILSPEEFEACEKDAELFPDKIRITTLTIEQLCRLAEIAAKQQTTMLGYIKDVPIKEKGKRVVHREQMKGKSLAEILSRYKLDESQMQLIKECITKGLNEEQIICVINKGDDERSACVQLFQELNKHKMVMTA